MEGTDTQANRGLNVDPPELPDLTPFVPNDLGFQGMIDVSRASNETGRTGALTPAGPDHQHPRVNEGTSMATRQSTTPCIHCNRQPPFTTSGRGLCWKCHLSPGVRSQYPALPHPPTYKRRKPPVDLVELFWANVRKVGPKGCWEWFGPYKGENNYGELTGPRRYRVAAHRFSYELFCGSAAGSNVLHRCDNRRCVNPVHLFLGTLTDNVADMVAKDRQAKGEQVANSKLTAELVMSVRRRVAAGEPSTVVARSVGVSRAHVRHIVRGLVWKHLPVIKSGAASA